MADDTTKIEVKNKLLEDAKKAFPYLQGLPATGLVDAVLRWAIDEKGKLKVKA